MSTQTLKHCRTSRPTCDGDDRVVPGFWRKRDHQENGSCGLFNVRFVKERVTVCRAPRLLSETQASTGN